MEVRSLPQMVYAAVRAVGPYQQTAGPAFHRLMEWAGGAGLITGSATVMGLSWDEPGTVPGDKLRYDAAITINRRIALPDGFRFGVLPAMTWALATHRGPYSSLTATFGVLMEEMAARTDLIPIDLCAIEIYRSPPGTAPADLVTDLGFPVVVFA